MRALFLLFFYPFSGSMMFLIFCVIYLQIIQIEDNYNMLRSLTITFLVKRNLCVCLLPF